MYSEDTVSGPTNVTSLFDFNTNIVKQVEGNCRHCTSYIPEMFWKVVANDVVYTSSLMHSQKKNVWGLKGCVNNVARW
jgi:hypothetical protein